MVRRLAILLLLPITTISQSVSLGRCRCDSPAGHAPRPHVHFHGGCKHHHHHHDDGLPNIPLKPVHDSDAVFLGGADPVVLGRGSITVDDPVPSRALDAIDVFVGVGEYTPSGSDLLTRPPPTGGPACPLYMRHLSLLI